MRETEQVPPRLFPAVPWTVKSGLLFDFYCPKWEKEYVFELEESFTDWVIQVYSLTFLNFAVILDFSQKLFKLTEFFRFF